MVSFPLIENAISISRQRGCTTALVKAAIETGGYLVFGTTQQAHLFQNDNPGLKAISVESLEFLRGREACSVFFDNTAIYEMAQTHYRRMSVLREKIDKAFLE